MKFLGLLETKSFLKSLKFQKTVSGSLIVFVLQMKFFFVGRALKMLITTSRKTLR